MTKRILLVAIATLATPLATAQDASTLIQAHNCSGCHAHGIGGTFESISAKYAGKADAPERLASVIKNGTRAGAITMPPTAVSDADAHAMASYVLASKK